MQALISNDFNTNLGTIRTWIETDHGVVNSNSFNVATNAHIVTLEVFELRNNWLPQGMKFETSKGWRWHIKKTNGIKENIIIYCRLIDPGSDCECNPDPGECLETVEIENKTHHLHIGTEDGEIMQARAKRSDEMPGRFKDELHIGNSFTHHDGFGFKTIIPSLNENERIYFHFLVATNTIKPSVQYPDERDVSTWYAVDKSKAFLDKYLDERKG